MAESLAHRRLVQELGDYVEHNYKDHKNLQVLSDMDNSSVAPRPPNLNSGIPDLYAYTHQKENEIIGEAKTKNDLDTPRSLNQIEGFLEYVSSVKHGVFILCVPWHQKIYAENILSDISNACGFNGEYKVISGSIID